MLCVGTARQRAKKKPDALDQARSHPLIFAGVGLLVGLRLNLLTTAHQHPPAATSQGFTDLHCLCRGLAGLVPLYVVVHLVWIVLRAATLHYSLSTVARPHAASATPAPQSSLADAFLFLLFDGMTTCGKDVKQEAGVSPLWRP